MSKTRSIRKGEARSTRPRAERGTGAVSSRAKSRDLAARKNAFGFRGLASSRRDLSTAALRASGRDDTVAKSSARTGFVAVFVALLLAVTMVPAAGMQSALADEPVARPATESGDVALEGATDGGAAAAESGEAAVTATVREDGSLVAEDLVYSIVDGGAVLVGFEDGGSLGDNVTVPEKVTGGSGEMAVVGVAIAEGQAAPGVKALALPQTVEDVDVKSLAAAMPGLASINVDGTAGVYSSANGLLFRQADEAASSDGSTVRVANRELVWTPPATVIARIPGTCKRVAAGAFTDAKALETIMAFSTVESIARPERDSEGNVVKEGAFTDEQVSRVNIVIPISATVQPEGADRISTDVFLSEQVGLDVKQTPWCDYGFAIERFTVGIPHGSTSVTVAVPEDGAVETPVITIGNYIDYPQWNPKPGEVDWPADGLVFEYKADMTVSVKWEGNKEAIPAHLELPAYVVENGVKTAVTEVAPNAFEGATQLESVIIPEGVTTIGESAFAGCSGLKSVELPSTLKTIDYAAFKGTGVQSVTVPSGVTAVGGESFADCAALEVVEVLGGPYVSQTATDDMSKIKLASSDWQPTLIASEAEPKVAAYAGAENSTGVIELNAESRLQPPARPTQTTVQLGKIYPEIGSYTFSVLSGSASFDVGMYHTLNYRAPNNVKPVANLFDQCLANFSALTISDTNNFTNEVKANSTNNLGSTFWTVSNGVVMMLDARHPEYWSISSDPSQWSFPVSDQCGYVASYAYALWRDGKAYAARAEIVTEDGAFPIGSGWALLTRLPSDPIKIMYNGHVVQGIRLLPAHNVNVVYDANADGDTVDRMPSNAIVNSGSMKFSWTAPTRAGYAFEGWQVDGAGDVYVPGAAVPASIMESHTSVTFVANWTPIEDAENPKSLNADSQLEPPTKPAQTKVQAASVYRDDMFYPPDGMPVISSSYELGKYSRIVYGKNNEAAGKTVQTAFDECVTDLSGVTVGQTSSSSDPANNTLKGTSFFAIRNGILMEMDIRHSSTWVNTNGDPNLPMVDKVGWYATHAWCLWDGGTPVEAKATIVTADGEFPIGDEWVYFTRSHDYPWLVQYNGHDVSTIKLEAGRQNVVAFDANAGADAVADMPAEMAADSYVDFTVPTNVPARSGYVFGGWNIEGTDHYYGAGETIPSDVLKGLTNIKLVAQWSETSDATIVVDVTKGANADAVTNGSGSYGSNASWQTKTGDDPFDYQLTINNAAIAGDNYVTQAKATADGSVQFCTNGGAVGYTLTPASTNADGWTVTHWKLNGTELTPGTAVPVTFRGGNNKLEISYTGTPYKLTLDPNIDHEADDNHVGKWLTGGYQWNDGTGSWEWADGDAKDTKNNVVIDTVYNDGVKLPGPGDLEREGFWFVGWAKCDADGAKNVNLITQDDRVDNTKAYYSDTTLVAVWEPRLYKLTFGMENHNNQPGYNEVSPDTKDLQLMHPTAADVIAPDAGSGRVLKDAAELGKMGIQNLYAKDSSWLDYDLDKHVTNADKVSGYQWNGWTKEKGLNIGAQPETGAFHEFTPEMAAVVFESQTNERPVSDASEMFTEGNNTAKVYTCWTALKVTPIELLVNPDSNDPTASGITQVSDDAYNKKEGILVDGAAAGNELGNQTIYFWPGKGLVNVSGVDESGANTGELNLNKNYVSGEQGSNFYEKDFRLKVPARKGYTFLGWGTDKDNLYIQYAKNSKDETVLMLGELGRRQINDWITTAPGADEKPQWKAIWAPKNYTVAFDARAYNTLTGDEDSYGFNDDKLLNAKDAPNVGTKGEDGNANDPYYKDGATGGTPGYKYPHAYRTQTVNYVDIVNNKPALAQTVVGGYEFKYWTDADTLVIPGKADDKKTSSWLNFSDEAQKVDVPGMDATAETSMRTYIWGEGGALDNDLLNADPEIYILRAIYTSNTGMQITLGTAGPATTGYYADSVEAPTYESAPTEGSGPAVNVDDDGVQSIYYWPQRGLVNSGNSNPYDYQDIMTPDGNYNPELDTSGEGGATVKTFDVEKSVNQDLLSMERHGYRFLGWGVRDAGYADARHSEETTEVTTTVGKSYVYPSYESSKNYTLYIAYNEDAGTASGDNASEQNKPHYTLTDDGKALLRAFNNHAYVPADGAAQYAGMTDAGLVTADPEKKALAWEPIWEVRTYKVTLRLPIAATSKASTGPVEGAAASEGDGYYWTRVTGSDANWYKAERNWDYGDVFYAPDYALNNGFNTYEGWYVGMEGAEADKAVVYEREGRRDHAQYARFYIDPAFLGAQSKGAEGGVGIDETDYGIDAPDNAQTLWLRYRPIYINVDAPMGVFLADGDAYVVGNDERLYLQAPAKFTVKETTHDLVLTNVTATDVVSTENDKVDQATKNVAADTALVGSDNKENGLCWNLLDVYRTTDDKDLSYEGANSRVFWISPTDSLAYSGDEPTGGTNTATTANMRYFGFGRVDGDNGIYDNPDSNDDGNPLASFKLKRSFPTEYGEPTSGLAGAANDGADGYIDYKFYYGLDLTKCKISPSYAQQLVEGNTAWNYNEGYKVPLVKLMFTFAVQRDFDNMVSYSARFGETVEPDVDDVEPVAAENDQITVAPAA